MSAKPIVVGIDGSPESTRAAVAAWRLAVATGAPFELIHAIPDVWAAAALAQVSITMGLSERLLAETRERMVGDLHGALPADALATLRVVVGPTDLVLADAAREAAMVVLGGKHHGALARTFGGSTAHHLIHTLDVPVLIVAPAARAFRRVLAAVDLSFATEPTLDAARAIARVSDARLRLVHVVEPGPDIEMERIGREAAEEFSRRAARAPDVAPEDRVMRWGPAAERIASEAADWDADLVVVGRHGRGWVQRMLVGSVTERLLALLPASLLVVPVRATPATVRRASATGKGAEAIV
jgi:nucleotide-binding universal stress UspA family protein